MEVVQAREQAQRKPLWGLMSRCPVRIFAKNIQGLFAVLRAASGKRAHAFRQADVLRDPFRRFKEVRLAGALARRLRFDRSSM